MIEIELLKKVNMSKIQVLEKLSIDTIGKRIVFEENIDVFDLRESLKEAWKQNLELIRLPFPIDILPRVCCQDGNKSIELTLECSPYWTLDNLQYIHSEHSLTIGVVSLK